VNAAVMVGCEPISHAGDSSTGVLILHGFTGSPWSLRPIALAMIDAGFDVELPRLPGHGTIIDDMVPTRWTDWESAVSSAFDTLRSRVDRVVVAGQSMGGTLAIALGLRNPNVNGLICVNPLTKLPDAATIDTIRSFLADGVDVLPGGRSDIADPDAVDLGYEGTPLAPLASLLSDGVPGVTGRLSELTLPLRLFTSRDDHVVAPDNSAHLIEYFGGEIEHSCLERSFHVATLDYDREFVVRESVAFVNRIGVS
jgi:carboxylesterase